MTRAKEHLQLLVPHRFYVTQQTAMGDRHIYAARTRFITDAMAAKFETIVWPIAMTEGAGAQQGGTARIQVRESSRSAWR